MSACPLCGGASAVALRTPDRNRGLSDVVFTYRRCEVCGSLWLENIPEDLSPYYPDDYYARPDLARLRELGAGEAYRMALLAPYATGGRLTEIGPGFGIFAVQAVDAGFDVTVIEMDRAMCEHLEATLGVRAVCSAEPERALAELPPSRVIVMWHVLEHLRDPWATLDAAAANLEPGGTLLIAVPNPEALGARVLGGRWPHVDAPRHLFLIPARTLAERARRAGLQAVHLTADDPGARHWNAFAWHYALRRPQSRWITHRLAQAAGTAIAAVLAPVERRGLRGAAYTMVLQKPT